MKGGGGRERESRKNWIRIIFFSLRERERERVCLHVEKKEFFWLSSTTTAVAATAAALVIGFLTAINSVTRWATVAEQGERKMKKRKKKNWKQNLKVSELVHLPKVCGMSLSLLRSNEWNPPSLLEQRERERERQTDKEEEEEEEELNEVSFIGGGGG